MIIDTIALSKLRVENWIISGNSPVTGLNELFANYEKIYAVSIVDDKTIKHPFDSLLSNPKYDIINLEFEDIDLEEQQEGYWPEGSFDPQSIFNIHQAQLITNHICKADDDLASVLYVAQCHAGISRSGTIVRFVKNTFKLCEKRFKQLNHHNLKDNGSELRLIKQAWRTQHE